MTKIVEKSTVRGYTKTELIKTGKDIGNRTQEQIRCPSKRCQEDRFLYISTYDKNFPT